MNKSAVAILLLILAVVAWRLRPVSAPEVPVEAIHPQEAKLAPTATPGPVASENQPTPNPPPTASPVKAFEKAPLKPLKEITPDLSIIREQVAKNPHVTPEALIGFSIELSERMEKALASESEARSLARELQECVAAGDGRVAKSVQSLCRLNAERLRRAYPSL